MDQRKTLPLRFPTLFNRRFPRSRLVQDLTRLDPAVIAEEYRGLQDAAPRRSSRGRAYFVGHSGITSTLGPTTRREEHLAIALMQSRLPRAAGWIEILDYQVPLKATKNDTGIGKADLIGVTDTRQLAVIELKHMEAASSGRSDPPPCALMEALRYAAMFEADLPALAAEAEARFERRIHLASPAIVLLGPAAWWRGWMGPDGCAPWTQAFARLIDGIALETGVSIECLGFDEVALTLGGAGLAPQLAGAPVFFAVQPGSATPFGPSLKLA